MINPKGKLLRVHHQFQPQGNFHFYAEPELWKGYSFELGLELTHVDTGVRSKAPQRETNLPEWVKSCIQHRDL